MNDEIARADRREKQRARAQSAPGADGAYSDDLQEQFAMDESDYELGGES